MNRRIGIWLLRICVATVLLAGASVTPAMASSDDWLGEINKYRAATGLPAVTEQPAWTQGIRNHLVYLDKTPASYFTGKYVSMHTENPASPYYTASGAQEADSSDLTQEDGGVPVQAIDGWLAAPFHAIGMLRPVLTKVAFANDTKTKMAGLDIIRGADFSQPERTTPILFPGPGMTTDLFEFSGEMPDPLQTCGWKSVPAVGLPLIAMLPVAPAAALTADLNGPNGLSETSLGQTLCIVDQYTYTTSDSVYGPTGKDILTDDHAVVLIPRVPLVNGAYSVAIHQVGQPDIAWSFNVLSSASSPALGAPAHLSYKRSGRRVTVSWAKVSGASSYRVSIKINGRTRVIRTGSLKTSFQASTRHSARVTVRGVGTGGKLGRSVSLTVARYH